MASRLSLQKRPGTTRPESRVPKSTSDTLIQTSLLSNFSTSRKEKLSSGQVKQLTTKYRNNQPLESEDVLDTTAHNACVEYGNFIENAISNVEASVTQDISIEDEVFMPKMVPQSRQKTLSVRGSAFERPHYPLFNKRVKIDRTTDHPASTSSSSVDDIRSNTGSVDNSKALSHISPPNVAAAIQKPTESSTNREPSVITISPPYSPSDLINLRDPEDSEIMFSQPSSPVNVGSQEDPITIDSSPIKSVSLQSRRENSRQHPRLISSRTHGGTTELSAKEKRAPMSMHIGNTPYPQAAHQHVKGTQTKFLSPPLPFTRAEKSRTQSFISENGDLRSILPIFTETVLTSTSVDINVTSSRCQLNGLRCPAISRLESYSESNRHSSMWNEKWRPRRATAVLGNESAANYLMAWLSTLAVQVNTFGKEGEVKNESQKRDMAFRNKASIASHRIEIIRSVNKRRKPRKRRRIDSEDEASLSDWIASDEEDLYIGPSDSDINLSDDIFDDRGDYLARPSTSKRLYRSFTAETENRKSNVAIDPANERTNLLLPDLSEFLTNTILLTGPSGSGKTAAVYACAEELGWEVFEVYPGIGKRNASNLNAFVGDAGKNHLVGPAQANRMQASLAKKNELQPTVDDFSLAADADFTAFQHHRDYVTGKSFIKNKFQEISEGSTGFAKEDSLNDDSRSFAIRQSLILIEEADILYNDDINFWPALINLVRECRRPVIMTCNDPNLVPKSELPLQTVLSFQSCPTNLAASYLQSIAFQEGYSVSLEDATAFYESTIHVDAFAIYDDFTRSAARQEESFPNIREAINKMQFFCQSANDLQIVRSEVTGQCKSKLVEVNHIQPPGDLEARSSQTQMVSVEHYAECRSFVDINTMNSLAIESEMYSTEPTAAKDEIGYKQLEIIPRTTDGILFYSWDKPMATEALSLARRNLPMHDSTTIEISKDRTKFLSNTEGVLKTVMREEVVARELMNGGILDYEAWIRIMVNSDDQMEKSEIKALMDGGRRMRLRSQKEGIRMDYERWITLTEEQRGTLRDTAFRVDERSNL